jgi:pyruvate formate lyase activating enzyme
LDLCQVIDAYKVDLKAFNDTYYQDVVHGRLRPVLDTLITLRREGIHSEIVYLTVPTLNDQEADIKKMVKWIYQELGPDVPLHFSRFHPRYKLKNLPPTPIKTLERLRQIGQDGGLHYVYLGNVPGHQGENTQCPQCQKIVIGRMGYQIFKKEIKQGHCTYCGYKIAGVWE